MNTINFKITGMHCASCEKIIKMELEGLEGVKNVSVDFKSGKASVEVDSNFNDQDMMAKTVEELGYKVQF